MWHKVKSFFIQKILRYFARRAPAMRAIYPDAFKEGVIPDFNSTFSRYTDLERHHLKLLESFETFKHTNVISTPLFVDKTRAPKVSVIMPIYKSEKNKLQLAIQSVISQSYNQYELLIIHTDKETSILEGLNALKDPQIKLIHSTLAHAAHQRNLGIEQATGEIITYLDHDNIWYPHYLDYIVSAFSNPMVQSTYMGQYIKQRDNDLHYVRSIAFDRDKFLLEGGIDGNVFAHRMSLYHLYGGWDVDLSRLQDFDLILRYSIETPPTFIPTIGGEYLECGALTISETQPFYYNYWKIKRKNLTKVNPSFRVLTLTGICSQITERYIDYELLAIEAYGIDTAVWAAEPGRAPDPTFPFKIYHGNLEEAILDFKPDLISIYWLHVSTTYQAILNRFDIPITLRSHSFETNEAIIEELTSIKKVKKIFVFPRYFNHFHWKEKLYPLPTAFHSTLFSPSGEKNKKQVVRCGACLPTKDLEGFIETALLCPAFEFTLILANTNGTGDFDRIIRAYNQQKGNPVHILGPLHATEIANILKTAGIYMYTLAAGTRFGMPLSIIEALASSCIVLVKEDPDARAYYSDFAFYYHTPKDAAKIINGSLQWTDAYWEKQGVSNSEFVYQHYMAIDTVKPMIGIWQDILNDT